MIGRMGNGIVAWVGARCRARRLLAGGRRHECLVEKIGRCAGAAAGHRLPPALWKRQGEALYRLFKLDPGQVPAAARVLCRQLLMLEAHLSELARHLGPSLGPPPVPTPRVFLTSFREAVEARRVR
jgi:hypothetical protein